MADPIARTDTTTVLGNDASFKGEIAFEGSMRIEGKFEGKIQTKGRLALGRAADVQADVNAGHITVEGSFKGNLSAQERVEVAASAKLQGDLRAPKLVVAEGATLIGNIHISPDALKSPADGNGTPARAAGAAERDLVGARR